MAGIVLAAGRSRRMGTPKPLLEADGVTFMERAVGTFLAAGCEPVLAVVRAESGVAELATRAGARPVVNDAPDSEQIDSIRLALRPLADAPEVGAAAVLPVDHPLVRTATMTALIARWREARDRIVRPVHGGRPGHPTLFPRSVWPALMAAQPNGARSIVEDPSYLTEDVAVEDPGIVADIDTPAAYAQWVDRA